MLCSKQVVEAKLLEAKKLWLKNFAPSLKSYMGKNYHLICIWQPITLTVSETMVLFFTCGFLLLNCVNGIAGSFHANTLSIPIQIMRKLISMQTTNSSLWPRELQNKF